MDNLLFITKQNVNEETYIPNNIEDLSFEDCTIENFIMYGNVKYLSFKNCRIISLNNLYFEIFEHISFEQCHCDFINLEFVLCKSLDVISTEGVIKFPSNLHKIYLYNISHINTVLDSTICWIESCKFTLPNFTNRVKELTIIDTPIEIREIIFPNKLESLSLDGISKKSIIRISKFPNNLKYLSCQGNKGISFENSSLKKLHKLKTLVLNNTNLLDYTDLPESIESLTLRNFAGNLTKFADEEEIINLEIYNLENLRRLEI